MAHAGLGSKDKAAAALIFLNAVVMMVELELEGAKQC